MPPLVMVLTLAASAPAKCDARAASVCCACKSRTADVCTVSMRREGGMLVPTTIAHDSSAPGVLFVLLRRR